MDSQQIKQALPEEARDLVSVKEEQNQFVLSHPEIDKELYMRLRKCVLKLGGTPGSFYGGAMHHYIPKEGKGVVPHVVSGDKSKPPVLGDEKDESKAPIESTDEPYDLAKSMKSELGQLVPVVLDAYGRPIDGVHRLEIDAKAQSILHKHIDTPVKKVLARLTINFCRRTMTHEELEKDIGFLIGNGYTVEQISEITGISERTVYRHMPEILKKTVAKKISDAMRSKSEVVRKELSTVSSSIKTQETREQPIPRTIRNLTHLRQCDAPGCVSREGVEEWNNHGIFLCPRHRKDADEKPERYLRIKKTEQTVAKLEKARVLTPKIEVKDTWKHRKATMQPQHSKMEEDVLILLQQDPEIGPIATDRFFCTEGTKPDFYLPKHKALVYLDGPPHEGKEDRDDTLRQKAAERHQLKIVSVSFKPSNNPAEVKAQVKEALS